jgi:hypothetical protein
MARVVYRGPHDGVVLPLPYGGEVECKRGEAVDVPDSLAPSLLEQESNWQAVAPARKREGVAA